MNSKFSFLSLLLLVLFSAQISFANKSAEALARKAVSENTAEALPAIEELRALGPVGLQTLMAQYREEITETSILRAMTGAAEALGRVTDEAAWKKIALLHSDLAFLDDRSIALIKSQNPTLADEELKRLLHRFQESIALDTVRNEYLLHSQLYTWLMRDAAGKDVEKLNEKVYASLFLTPNSDPWLGLFSSDVYTALDRGGVVKP